MISELYTQKPVLPFAPSLQDIAKKNGTLSRNTSLKISDSLDREKKNPNSKINNIKGRSPIRGITTTNTSSIRKRNKSAPRTSFEDYEERTLPALRQ